MKNRILALAVVIMGFGACKEVGKLTQFTMSFDNQVTIPANTLTNIPVSFSTPEVPTNSQSTFDGNNTNAGSIEEIKLQNMTLTVISPAGNNFNFFKSVEVFIKAEGFSEVLIGSDNDVTDGTTSLSLTTSEANIKDYITANKFSIRVATTTDEAISQDHEINIKSVFFVDAKVLGQ